MRERVTALLQQRLPDGVNLDVVLSVEETDNDTLDASEWLANEFYARVHEVTREPGTTSVQGWNLAYAYAAAALSPDWLVLGADDLVWHDGWLVTALRVAADNGAHVIGLDDGSGKTDLNKKACHYLVSYTFTQKVLGGVMVPPAYKSWRFDREVSERARALGMYAPAWAAKVEHMHPDWKKAEMDETYRQAWPLHDADLVVLNARQKAGWPVDYPPAALPEVEAAETAVADDPPPPPAKKKKGKTAPENKMLTAPENKEDNEPDNG
jgi:hypothetical protein